MKKYLIVFVVVLFATFGSTVNAQMKQMPFFEKNGTVAIQTNEMKFLADTIAVINHRADDVVWSRIVYRIIDMRDKQNYQLYFPVLPNEQYKSLFRLILEAAVKDTLRAYDKIERSIQPMYKHILPKDSLSKYFVGCTVDTVNRVVVKTPLIENDPITNMPIISRYAYKDFVKDQVKFVIQEIVFFDKHLSRMYSKIIAIAPYFPANETNVTLSLNGSTNDTWSFFQSSVLCWFPFDELRPYLARQYVIPNGNETQRLTYDEFFAQKLYSTYVLGESNMVNRMLLETELNVKKIRKEQARIETELLNFEQDLWEY